MNEPDTSQAEAFNGDYFKNGPYARVSFQRYSQYW
jgi:hypothetical protein